MKIYKNKFLRTINFIKNEGKFNRSDFVEVLENKSKYEKYDKYVGKRGIVTDINYSKKDYVVGVKFEDGKNLDFMPKELKKLGLMEEMSEEYKKLLYMI